MVDIHNHILFGVDDGPKTLEESLELLENGAKLGFKVFYLTSHHGKGKYRSENYEENFKILEEALEKRKLNVKIKRGNEIYLDENLEEIFQEKKFSPLEENYILVEFSPLVTSIVARTMIGKILREGYIPIIAHVERYSNLKKRDLLNLKKMGSKIQVNIGSHRGKHILKMLKNGDIDYLASDCHGGPRRNYNLEREMAELKKLVGKRKFNEMTCFFMEGEKRDEKKQPGVDVFRTFLRNLWTRTGIGRDSKKSGKF